MSWLCSSFSSSNNSFEMQLQSSPRTLTERRQKLQSVEEEKKGNEYATLSLVANLSFILNGNHRKGMVTTEAYLSVWTYPIMTTMKMVKTADTSYALTSSRHCVQQCMLIISTDPGYNSKEEILLWPLYKGHQGGFQPKVILLGKGAVGL